MRLLSQYLLSCPRVPAILQVRRLRGSRAHRESADELFGKQGAAGINFSQYTKIRVEKTGCVHVTAACGTAGVRLLLPLQLRVRLLLPLQLRVRLLLPLRVRVRLLECDD